MIGLASTLLCACLGSSRAGDPYDGVRAALQRLGPDDMRSGEALVEALASLGPKSIPVQYQLVLGTGLDALIGEDWDPAAWACTPEEIPDLCRRSLAELPAKDVIAYLEEVSKARPVIKERVVVLRLLATLHATDGLALVWRTCAELGALELGYPSVRAAVREALGAILTQAPGAWDWVQERLEKTDEATAQILVETLGEVRSPQGMPILEALLARSALPEVTLLGSMAALEGHTPWQLAGTTARYLEPRFQSQEPEERALAAAIAGRLVLAETAPTLLELLDDAEPRVQYTAASALALLAHRAADTDPVAWSAWYQEERTWHEQRVPELLETLTRARPGPASDALRELCQHPLWKREMAREIAARLAQAPYPVGLTACTVLEELAVRDALPGLVQALSARDTRLKKAAWLALQSLSGEDLPLDSRAWNELVAAR